MSEAKVIIKTANIKHRLKLLDALPIKYDVVVKSAYCKEWLLEIFKPRHLCFTEINKLGNRKDKTMLKIPNKNKMIDAIKNFENVCYADADTLIEFKDYEHNQIVMVDDKDNREGVSITELDKFATKLKKAGMDMPKTCFINYGCCTGWHPNKEVVERGVYEARKYFEEVSVGGSFVLKHVDILDKIDKVRVGEYLMMGTIPHLYSSDDTITIEAEILQTKTDGDILLDLGYQNITKNANPQIKCVNSDYSVVSESPLHNYSKGDMYRIKPDYTSFILAMSSLKIKII